MTIRYEDERKLAKRWAAQWGVHGKAGGWIYDSDGTRILQGWDCIFYALRELGMIDENGEVGTAYATPNVLRSAYRRHRARQSTF